MENDIAAARVQVVIDASRLIMAYRRGDGPDEIAAIIKTCLEPSVMAYQRADNAQWPRRCKEMA
jgi:hypothetical protein